MYTKRSIRGGAGRILGVLAAAAVLAAAGAARGDDPKPAPGDEKLHRLLEQRVETARQAYNGRLELYTAGKLDLATLAGTAHRLVTAELELLDKKEDRVAACEKNLERFTLIRDVTQRKLQAGMTTPSDAEDAEYDRLDAAILLEREKAK